MALQLMKKILTDALKGGYAVGYFEPWDQYSTEAIVRAAEDMNSPVIIGCGALMMNQKWFDHWGMEALAKIGEVIAKRSKVDTCLILNEALSFDQIVLGLKYGFNAVMLDSSHLPFEENMQITKKVVKEAHAAGADVEAELGRLPMGTDKEAGMELTDPDQAAEFIERTGADALAVSVGNVHVRQHGKSEIDFHRLQRISTKVHVPLVIHGTTGLSDDSVKKAIPCGVAKFNVGTALKKAFLDGVKEAVSVIGEDVNPQTVIGSRKKSDILFHACDRISLEVKRFIAMFTDN
ncbi:MAG: class II fructose-bisphosphate aldolase [Spirochaetota bacterium]|nr:MAG: class II fructose-bisphosphate aldolase [Spirochaetota bacterium]